MMNGGDGAQSFATDHDSYINHIQKLESDAEKGMIQSAVIEYLDAEISGVVRIADLRSSAVAKSFFTVEDLIEAVGKKYGSSSENRLEFQVLFNNHTHNDFNALFASLPPERQYHAAGVPGSFYRRLFPSNSIAIAFSTRALHWLSVQPKLGLTNAGRIHDIGASEDVARAYSDHFAADLGDFLNARAEEIVRGGLLFAIMLATRDDGGEDGVSPSVLPVLFDYLGSALMELAGEGSVEKSAIDAFNLPFHFPKLGEMQRGVEKNGCFSIEIMEFPKETTTPRIHVGSLLGHMRDGLDGILTPYFGASVVDQMFAKTLSKAQEISRCFEGPQYKSSQLFVVLKRK